MQSFRYRSYYLDKESNFYYLQSRYYDPVTHRFINADDINFILASPATLTDKNLYSYCDNNPIIRFDDGGQFWDYIIDFGFVAKGFYDVAKEPGDWRNWASLGVDTVCAVVPFLPSGAGQIIRVANKVDDAVDVVNSAKSVYKVVNKTSDISKATGSYEIIFKSGYNYIGKGGIKRAINSAKRLSKKHSDEAISIVWESAKNSRQAFIDEYLKQKKFGGVLSSNPNLRTYNKIWSPGKRYFGD